MPLLTVLLQILHEIFHSLDTANEVLHLVLVRLLVQSPDGIIDSLAEDGRETDAHSGVCEGLQCVQEQRALSAHIVAIGDNTGLTYSWYPLYMTDVEEQNISCASRMKEPFSGQGLTGKQASCERQVQDIRSQFFQPYYP